MKVWQERRAETERRGPTRQVALICLVLALVTFAVYSAVRHHDFVHYDDYGYVVDNESIQNGLNPSTIFWAFTTGYCSNWHPLTWFSHLADVELYGVKNAGGHHLTSLLIHIADVLLLFLVLRRMTGATWRSAAVAALFAWHPLHVESVAWVAERKDVLSTFFWLLTMFAYVRYVEESRAQSSRAKFYYRWTLVCFGLGLMSKPMVVTLPFALLLLDCWPLRRNVADGERSAISWLQLVREKWPMFLMTVVACAITFVAQKHGGAVVDLQNTPLHARLGNALIAYVEYLRKMVWPSDLGVLYPFPNLLNPTDVIVAAVVLVILSAAALALTRSRPYVLIGWLWFLGTLVPVIGVVKVGAQSMADRYSYMPLVGIFIICVWGLNELFGKDKSTGANPAAVIITPLLLACLVMTWRQVGYWKDTESLFRRDLAVTTNNPAAHINLGLALDESGRPEEARKEYEAALELDDSASSMTGMGEHLARQGDITNAINYYNSALKKTPFYGDAHYNLGNVLAHEGRFEEAAAHYTIALQDKPESADAHNNLGAVLFRLGQLQEALAEFKTALRLKPKYPEAQDQIASLYLKMGHPDLAQVHYEEAVRLKPNFAHAHAKLGLVLAQQGHIDQAIPQLVEALKLEPQNSEAAYNLAAAYAALNRFGDAAKAFAEVVRLKPENAEARARLAAALFKDGKVAEAVQAYRDTWQLKPDAPGLLRDLAWILATNPKPEIRNGAEAVRLAEHANELTGDKEPEALSALDVAYAEAGRFDEAIKTAQRVQELAGSDKVSADAAAKRLELYRVGKPFHE